MAQKLINNLINSDIIVEDLVFWLTSDNSQDSICKQFDDTCTKAEFAVHFLDFLKNQFTSVLQAFTSATTKQPIKLELKKEETKLLNSTSSFQKSTTPSNNSIRLDSPDCNEADKVVKTSTPIPKKRVSLSNAYSVSEENNPAFCTQEIGRASLDLHNKRLINRSPDASKKVKNILKDSINKSCSDVSSNGTLNRSFETAATSYSDLIRSPSSSLHNQSLPAAWPAVTPKSQHKSTNKSLSTSSNSSSSKKNNSNKGGKFTPRQTFSLGDFISMDQKSNKKADKTKNDSSNQSREDRQNEDHNDSLTVNDEMFPKITSNPRKKKRIKPTTLETRDVTKRGCSNQKDKIHFGIVARPAVINPTFIEAPPADECTENVTFEAERQLLKQERQKKSVQIVIRKDGEPLVKTPIKVIPPASLVSPSFNSVSSVDTLNTLIKVYCAFWDCNMIVNPMSELYFVIYLITLPYVENMKQNQEQIQQLSTTDNGDENDDNLFLDDDLGCSDLADSNEDEQSCCDGKSEKIKNKQDVQLDKLGLFDSPHNCVYFACSVLENQQDLLTNLDKPTLKLLAENHRIASFKPELSRYLNEKYNFKSSQVQKMKQLSNAKMDESNVCFQMDTDNVENFSSEKSFRMFHKQRDLFYEIFQDWEEHHVTPNWNFSAALGVRIQKMLSMHNDVTDYYHFAKLFKSQLMSSCLNNENQEEPIDDENLSLLRSLKLLNVEKLTQLTERLVKPLTSNGPVPTPTFHGKQEFFKGFLYHANNHLFYHHLQNCLIYEILELNNAQFGNNEIENQEFIIDDYTKRLFVNNVSSSRLLAKFLGLLTSLPYLTESNVTESVISCQISLRSQVMPPLNIQECIQNSIYQGRLSVTLPWVIEFLAMLDSTTLCLPYYLQTLEFLYYLYRASDNAHFETNKNFMSKQTIVLVKFSIGWLFELPNFPKQIHYSWQLNHSTSKLKEICLFKESESTMNTSMSNQIPINLDKLDIIDDVALYLCCPFLSELRILLLTGKSNVNNSNPTRHITPVSSGFKKESCDSKQLQLQLEEAFFNGQPSSTRKIVDFVSERVASCCTKYICYTIFPKEKDNILAELRTIIQNLDESKLANCNKKGLAYKTSINEDMVALSKSYSMKIKGLCQDIVYKMCDSRIRKCVEAMLPEDTLQQVKDTCISVAVRMAMERVKKWVSTHIVEGELFIKDMNGEINRITKSTEIKHDECLPHDPDATSPTSALTLLRDYILNLLEEGGIFMTLPKVTEILNNVKDSLERREDLLPIPGKIVFSLSVDFSLSLLTFRPDLMTYDVQKMFIDIWKTENLKNLETVSPMTRILAPRNILLLEKSKTNKTWDMLAVFIKKLLDNDLLTIDCLSDQCVAVFRDEWQVTTLQNLSKFLSEVVSDMKSLKQQEDAERIRTLLEWVAGAYHDIEFFD